jgi:hypothetical protein
MWNTAYSGLHITIAEYEQRCHPARLLRLRFLVVLVPRLWRLQAGKNVIDLNEESLPLTAGLCVALDQWLYSVKKTERKGVVEFSFASLSQIQDKGDNR